MDFRVIKDVSKQKMKIVPYTSPTLTTIPSSMIGNEVTKLDQPMGKKAVKAKRNAGRQAKEIVEYKKLRYFTLGYKLQFLSLPSHLNGHTFATISLFSATHHLDLLVVCYGGDGTDDGCWSSDLCDLGLPWFVSLLVVCDGRDGSFFFVLPNDGCRSSDLCDLGLRWFVDRWIYVVLLLHVAVIGFWACDVRVFGNYADVYDGGGIDGGGVVRDSWFPAVFFPGFDINVVLGNDDDNAIIFLHLNTIYLIWLWAVMMSCLANGDVSLA
ncbi:hypothetical protein QVD17_00668 [Tagetes erecta]|uniref:Uncharacterized protein n=1 Tax=Tagetes erecta TaxID=13708 RepID=A0AAD8P628_TARER|nr:hypothetical protein QVD17_00668 [Tagetes erecta]